MTLNSYQDILQLISQKKKNEIITIIGPTATGKTKLAVRIARNLNAEIISADSRQVYRRMDIGTGKDLSDYTIDNQLIPHHLVDVAEPGSEYNVAQFQQTAYQIMEEIRQRGKEIVLCGGSGMYVEAILNGYRLSPITRDEELYLQLNAKSDEELTELLKSFGPLHNHTDTCERKRLLKAVEIELYYQAHPEWQEYSQPVPSVIIGLTGNRDIIRKKITIRLKERLGNGMIEEVQQLINSGVSSAQLIRYGLEYKYITLFLQGSIDYNTLFEKLNIAIHQFSKRQMTWFRRMERKGLQIHWVNIASL
ncbi:MAG: tRNA (adenosine(37)-N6)-dimethylallyltransferase MiaA [Bacteroidales bacterium]|nr:tRNA (adenosine(37)-N6)-dimethylallyltransferase MiaA [Bacteroidales bacterium]